MSDRYLFNQATGEKINLPPSEYLATGQGHRKIPVHEAYPGSAQKQDTANPLNTQVAGGHYKDLVIQPVEYIHANQIPFIEGCIIKYVTRWRNKGGLDDLRKAKHFVDLLIELETRNNPAVTSQPTQL